MTDESSRFIEADQERRRLAEDLAAGEVIPAAEDVARMGPEVVARTIFELRVHQIELEMQNEELRRTQGELHAARARYFDLYDLAPVGYLTLGGTGLILEANLTAGSLLGVPRSALLKRPLSQFVARPDQDPYYLRLRQVVGTGLPQTWEAAMNRCGEPFWAQLRASSVQLSDGRTVALMAVTDVSERRLAEEQNRALQAQLQQSQKLESLGSLAGGVAHNMNNVLGAILAMATGQLALLDQADPARDGYATIAEAASRGGKLAGSLLQFARQHPAEELDLDLNALLREELHLLHGTVPARIRLVVELAPDLRGVRGDPGALAHAFMNLVVNAMDAMPEGGTLTIGTRNLGADRLEVRVEDTGTGMTGDVLARAADPFFTTKAVGKGTGLGLSMVHGTMAGHHGRLDIQSAAGAGTRVRLEFPAGPAAAALPVLAAQAPAPAGERLKVLVVDDDDLIQRTTRLLVTVLGHGATVAASGEEAVELVEQGFQPDLVILDMNMPGMDGAATLPRLRAILPAVPVLLATGRADQEALDLVAGHEGVTLLGKPFSLEELRRHL